MKTIKITKTTTGTAEDNFNTMLMEAMALYQRNIMSQRAKAVIARKKLSTPQSGIVKQSKV
jgi:hypothetical protein